MSRNDAIGVVGDLLSLALAIQKAIASDRVEKVRDILPEEMRTSIAKKAADAAARMKLGT